MTKKTDREILKRLQEEGKKKGIHSSLLEFYQNLFCIQARVKQHISIAKPGLKQKDIDERMQQGMSLLNVGKLALDWLLLENTFAEVVAAFNQYGELFESAPHNLSKPDSPLLKKTVKAWLQGDSLPAEVTADGTNKYLLEAILHTTLKPFLTSYSDAFSGMVKQEQWRRGYCPVCGGSPDFSFLEKERGARWLLCSRCDTQWLFQRLACPYCGTQDQSALAYFTDDTGLYRLYVCEQCKGYLKAIDLRQTETEVLIPLERFLTSELDAEARERGYIPKAKSQTRGG